VGGWFFPDGSRLLVNVAGAGRLTRLCSMSVEGGELSPLSPEKAWYGMVIAPDGGSIVCLDRDGAAWRYPVGPGETSEVRGFESGDAIVQWSADGKSLYGFKDYQVPLKVFRLDIATGRKETWKEIRPSDPAGVIDIWLEMTPDASAYAYNLRRILSDLYLVEGLK
jgi:hypothetical protein